VDTRTDTWPGAAQDPAGEAHANCGFHTAEGLLGKNQDRHRHTDKFYVDEEKLTPATVAHVNETQTPDSKDE
jgi:hypothetical protein